MSILRGRLAPVFKKSAWPNPQGSIGEWLSKMGSHNCWEAIGSAREQWIRLARDIQKHLEDCHDPIPKGVIWSGYMIGRTKETAKPTVLFCSIDPSSRKQVRKIVLTSGLLENYPGFRTAECSKPPDFDRLVTMALEESSTFVACLHKQIPFGSILVEVRKQSPRTPYIWAYIRRR